jgi:UDP-glucose 4-epimerase
MTEQTILVTGGAGYIGSHTIVSLAEMTDYRIVSADDYSNSSAVTYDRIKSITGREIEHVQADLSDREQAEMVFEKFPGITGIIHFAAYKSVPESVGQPLKYYRNNVNSLIHMLELCSERNVNSFIFSSSCSIYGNISSLPVNENTRPERPESPYAFTKAIGERVLEDAVHASESMKGIALRYFNPVGAHPTGHLGELPTARPNNLVPVITQTAIGKLPKMKVFGDDYPTRDGTCIRDYVHVCDIAEAHVIALERLLKNSETPKYDVLNLGTGDGVTVLEAIRTFEKISGLKLNYEIAPRRPGDVGAIYSDSSKTKATLGWEARRSLDEMMSSAWKWEQYLKQTGS